MIESHALEYLLNSLWQVPVLALATALTITLLQPGQRTRHTLWALTLLAAIALPLHSRQTAYTPTLHTLQPTSPFIHAVFALYLCTVLLSLTRVYLANRRAIALLAGSTPRPITAEEQAILKTLTRNPPRILIAAAEMSPILLGIRRPVILFPPSLAACSLAEFTAILAHELAHLQRRDLLADLTLRLLAAPIAYHPATAFLHRRIRHTRELLCDAAAARALPSPHAYAHTLLQITHNLVAAPSTGIAFFNSTPTLEDRIMHLITPPPTRTQRLTRLATAATLVLGAIFAATSFHLIPVAHAQQTTSTYPNQTVVAVTPATATAPQTTKTYPNQTVSVLEPTTAAPTTTVPTIM